MREETKELIDRSKALVRDHIEDLKRQLREKNITHVQQWKPVAKRRLLIGRMRITPTERLGDPGAVQERCVYIDLAHVEWQVRQSINDGIKSMLMAPLIIEGGTEVGQGMKRTEDGVANV